MLARTSVTGPLPTGGSSPVSAVSCSSTSQPSYPSRARPRPRRSGRPPRRAAGTARPATACTSDSSPARRRRRPPVSTSFRWTWTTRSPWRRTNSAGSKPPISRCPVSRHQPTSVSRSIRSTSAAVSTCVPTCGCSASVSPCWATQPLDLGGMARDALPRVVVERHAGRPRQRRATTAALKTSAPAAASTAAIALGRRRCRASALVQHDRHEAADEPQPVAVERLADRLRLERQVADRAELGRRDARARPSRRTRARVELAAPARDLADAPRDRVRRPAVSFVCH